MSSDTGSAVEGQHWHQGVNGDITTTRPRSGLRALYVNVASAAKLYERNFPTSSAHHIYRIYFFFEALPSVNVELCRSLVAPNLSGGPFVYFQQSTSKIFAAVGSSASPTLGASGVTIETGRWICIDTYFFTNLSGNDTCDVQVDGIACGQASASGFGSSLPDAMSIGVSNSTCEFYMDDVVVSFTAADYPIGPSQGVLPIVPIADGTHNIAGGGDFQHGSAGTDITNATTDAWTLIDDLPAQAVTGVGTTDFITIVAPPNATDYIECRLGIAPSLNLPPPRIGPQAVEAFIAIHQAGTGAGNMEVRLNDNGTMGVIYTATGVAGTTNVRYKFAHFAIAPSGAAWHARNDGSDGDIYDLRMRFGSPASVDANPDQYLDSFMLEADFPYISPPAWLNINQARNRAATF